MRRPRFAKPADELTVVDHLEELRLRLFVSLAAFGVALALCLWQSSLLLRIADAPLGGRRPTTFGVTEPFTATLTVAGYAALALALPVVLHQAYAYLVPALLPAERRLARPLLLIAPALFLGGAAFGYFVVLPSALHFLLHFQSGHFNVQIRARDWYSFLGTSVLACGLVFEIPLAIVGAARLGIVTPRTLRAKRRYAIAVCAVIAAALPGVDPVTMLIEMLPLIALYELSILGAALVTRYSAPAWTPSGPGSDAHARPTSSS
jgi:sec-independent protein translocase protein TatC